MLGEEVVNLLAGVLDPVRVKLEEMTPGLVAKATRRGGGWRWV